MFLATVWIGDRRLGCGQGRSKKQAEQVAAREGWRVLSREYGVIDEPGEPDPEPEMSGETHG